MFSIQILTEKLMQIKKRVQAVPHTKNFQFEKEKKTANPEHLVFYPDLKIIVEL